MCTRVVTWATCSDVGRCQTLGQQCHPSPRGHVHTPPRRGQGPPPVLRAGGGRRILAMPRSREAHGRPELGVCAGGSHSRAPAVRSAGGRRRTAQPAVTEEGREEVAKTNNVNGLSNKKRSCALRRPLVGRGTNAAHRVAAPLGKCRTTCRDKETTSFKQGQCTSRQPPHEQTTHRSHTGLPVGTCTIKRG